MNYIDKIGTLTIGQASKVLPFYMLEKEPILLRGRHGIGKSEVVYQASKKFIEDGLVTRVIEKRISQLTDGEMTGLQKVDGNFTEFVPVDWLYHACNEPVVLFLDEIDRALKELRQGVFQLLDSRTFNGMKLHPGTIVIAAVNGGLNGKDYQVQLMDPAELSRYCVIDVREDFSEWVEYCTQNNLVRQEILHFLSDNEEHFCPIEIKKNMIQPCPRSWVKLSNFLEKNKLFDVQNFDDHLFNLCRPRVGTDASMHLIQFLNNNYRKVSIFEIMEGKVQDQLNSSQISSIIEYKKLLSIKDILFQKKYSTVEINRLADWICTIPEEFCMAAIGNIVFMLLYENNPNHEELMSVKFLSHLFESEKIRGLYQRRSDDLVNTSSLDFIDSIIAGAMVQANEGQSAEDLLDSIVSDSGLPRTKIKWDFVVGPDGKKRLNVDTFPGWENLTPEEIEEQKLLWPQFFEHNKKIFHGPHPDNDKNMRNKTWRVFGYYKHDIVKLVEIFYKDPNTNRITWFQYIIHLEEDVKQHDVFEELPMTNRFIEIFDHPDHLPIEIYNKI
jgi:hypothetical protein